MDIMTIHDMDGGFGSPGACREQTLPRSDAILFRKDGFERNTNFGPVLEFKVAHHVYKCGIEIGVTSLKNGGSQSWIVISWSVNIHVDELREENGTSIHNEEVTTGAGGPVATKQREQSNPPSPSFSKMFVPINQRKWKRHSCPSTMSMRDPCHSESRRQRPEYYHIEVFTEKMKEQWFGIHCYKCCVATVRTPRDGRIMSG